jgi:hypothetical protein
VQSKEAADSTRKAFKAHSKKLGPVAVYSLVGVETRFSERRRANQADVVRSRILASKSGPNGTGARAHQLPLGSAADAHDADTEGDAEANVQALMSTSGAHAQSRTPMLTGRAHADAEADDHEAHVDAQACPHRPSALGRDRAVGIQASRGTGFDRSG